VFSSLVQTDPIVLVDDMLVVQRRKLESDELQMRLFFEEGDVSSHLDAQRPCKSFQLIRFGGLLFWLDRSCW
jgi:hypothetical protein